MRINQIFVPTVTMAKVILSTTSKLMFCSSSPNNYDGFKFKNINYQVPVGKTLRVWAISANLGGVAGSALPSVGYGDTGVLNTIASPVNPIVVLPFLGFSSAQYARDELALYAEIPAGKFPFIQAAVTSANASFLCEEI